MMLLLILNSPKLVYKFIMLHKIKKEKWLIMMVKRMDLTLLTNIRKHTILLRLR